MKNFKERYYLEIPLTEVANSSMYGIQLGLPSKCKDMFSNLWCCSHFFDEVGYCIYLQDDLSHEETYLKRKSLSFWEVLGFVDDVTHFRTGSKKQNKLYIETCFLVEATTREERHVIFGK